MNIVLHVCVKYFVSQRNHSCHYLCTPVCKSPWSLRKSANWKQFAIFWLAHRTCLYSQYISYMYFRTHLRLRILNLCDSLSSNFSMYIMSKEHHQLAHTRVGYYFHWHEVTNSSRSCLLCTFTWLLSPLCVFNVNTRYSSVPTTVSFTTFLS